MGAKGRFVPCNGRFGVLRCVGRVGQFLLRRKSALGGEQGGVGGVKGRFDAGIFGVVGWEKIKSRGVRAGGFGRRVLHGKKKKYRGVEQGGAENGEREKKMKTLLAGASLATALFTITFSPSVKRENA